MALTSITKDFVVKSGALVEGTSFVTSSTGQTGTLQVNGGAAIAKNLIVGTTATIWGTTTLQGPLIVNGYSQLTLLTATIFTATSANIIGNETVGGNLQVTGLFTATGAAELGSTLKVTGNSLFNGAANTFSGALFVTGTNITALGGTLTVSGVTNITNTTTANSAGGTAAFIVGGGAYIADNLVVKSTAYNTATNTANAIYTAGGIYADKGLTVAGPTLFKDAVTFAGTTTYVYSTQTVYTDNLIELHTPPTGVNTPWFIDDGKDIGIRFHYYTNSTDTNAALVLANDTKYLEWYNSGAENSTGTFVGASYGTFKTGNIYLTSATNATSTITGAFQITNGGAGIGGNVWAGGLAATNLTTASGIVYSIGGKLQNSEVTWNSSLQQLEGRIAYTNTATNITGGAAGSLPYQTGAGATTMLPIGSNGYILSVSGGNPAWASVSSLSAGNATTATNIAGGLADQIPYQSGPGQTVFNAGLRFNGTTFTATNAVISNTANATGYNNNTGALQVKGGAAINNDLWVGGDINLQGNLYLKGVGLDQLTASTGTFDYLILEGTGTSLTVFDGVTVGGVTNLNNFTSVSSTSTGALQVKGGIGVNGGIYAGGIVTATLFSGPATQVQTLAQTGNNTYYPTFVDSNNASVAGESVYTTSSFTINAQTGLVSIGGSASITGQLTVTGYSTFGLVTATSFTATSANILGNETVGGNLTVTGLSTLNGGTTTTNFTATNSRIIGNESVGGAFTVTGYSTFGLVTATTFTATSANIIGPLTVSGYSQLTLLTATTFTATSANILGNETVGGNLTVTGYTQMSLLTATTFTATSANILGNETVGGNLTVTGYSTLGLVTATVFTATSANIIGNETVGGTLVVTGRTTLGDAIVNNTITATNLVVTGTATLPAGINLSNLTVTNLTVTNNETVGGTLVVTGLTSLNGGATTGIFTATGVTYLTNTTDSNAINNGALIVSGGVGIAKSLVVGEDVTVGTASTQTVVNAYYSNNFLLSSYTSGFITSNALINLDTYSSSAYRTCKYVIQIVDGTKIHVEEILLFHDGTNVYMTEYGIVTSQGELGTFDAALVTGTVTLNFTANYTPTNMTIKTVRQAITI